MFDALVPKGAMQQFGCVMQHQIVLIAHLNADLEATGTNRGAMATGLLARKQSASHSATRPVVPGPNLPMWRSTS